jgi:cyclopropane fatty-acyl-phospholipid synthase-like methyltransferase
MSNSIGNYYNNLVEKFGDDPRSADYGHANSQAIKFNVLSEATNYTNKSILDIGCGFADYYDFLESKYKNIEYHGVDLSSKMIETAKIKHPELTLELKNVFDNPPSKKYDVVTANGIFYLLGKDSKILMHEFISKMFEMANDVVVFNTLSTWATDQEPIEFYADPSETLNFCKKLSQWVTIRHDYHPRDFTIYLYKNRNI